MLINSVNLRATAATLVQKPISAIDTETFCKNWPDEFCQDSRQNIGDLLSWKDGLTKT